MSELGLTHPHITVCICTFRRQKLLRRLLDGLSAQQTDRKFTFSVLVVDNDSAHSAEDVVEGARRNSPLELSYVTEERQGIALARNKAVANAKGAFIAFIDDDEIPPPLWLATLFNALRHYDVDGVLGPVKPHFDEGVPRWVVDGGFYDRPSYSTGLVIDWRKGRTGNVLLKRKVLLELDQPFRPEFSTGEDQDCFRRLIEKGHVFVWCHEAIAYEVVPPVRWRRSFMLKRALLRGKISLRHANFGATEIVKSLVAVPLYALVLPFLFIQGQHTFMKYLVKIFDHVGRILAVLGLNPVKESYVTE